MKIKDLKILYLKSYKTSKKRKNKMNSKPNKNNFT